MSTLRFCLAAEISLPLVPVPALAVEMDISRPVLLEDPRLFVFAAKKAMPPVCMPAGVESAHPHVKKCVVGVVGANHEIDISVVGSDLVDVVHLGTLGQRLPKNALDHQYMFGPLPTAVSHFPVALAVHGSRASRAVFRYQRIAM